MPSSVASGSEQLLHATCVALWDHGILLLGRSGTGKSDLALRMITTALVVPMARVDGALDQPCGMLETASLTAKLVADDQVLVWRDGEVLMARAPSTIAGMLEVRGVGIVEVPTVAKIALSLAVELRPRSEIERLPSDDQVTIVCDRPLTCLYIDPWDASAPAKVALALRRTGTMS